MNRIQSMFDHPSVFFEDGMKDSSIQKYIGYYQDYAEDMFDSWDGGQIRTQPYEQWLNNEHPKVFENIKAKQYTEAGLNLEKVGTNVLEGGLNYRYSGAFEEYAKLMLGRIIARESRQSLYAPSLGAFLEDSESEDNELVRRRFINEGTFWKELSGGFDGQQFSARNIVQDRLMAERFYMLNHIDEDGREVKESVVANLFLHRLWIDESHYRYDAMRSNGYFPQYITVGTVDDPDHTLGRKTVDFFVNNVSLWDNEENDSVVTLSSVKLKAWPTWAVDQYMDRNVQILPNFSMSDDPEVQKKSGRYIFHSEQMLQTNIIREEYDNPLTGTDDEDLIMRLDPNEPSSNSGKKVVIRVDSAYYGQSMKVKIKSRSQANVKLIKRDQYQTWDRMEPVSMTWNEGNVWEAEIELKPSDKIKDYLISSNRNIEVSYDPDLQDEQFFAKYPYYIQMLDNTLKNGTMVHTFRVIDRGNGQSVGSLSGKDFIATLNDQALLNPNITVTKKTFKRSSNILLNLDYSGSMNGWPKDVSRLSADRYLLSLQDDTKAKVGVVGFTDKIQVLHKMTQDYMKAAKSVYVDMEGGTALYDAIVAGANLLSYEPGNKSMILMTDGNDGSSSATLEEAIETAKNYNLSIYIVALGDMDMDILQQIADETGGKLLYALMPNDLSELYSTVTEEEDYIYTLKYDDVNLNQENRLLLQLTGGRSNEAEANYGPLSFSSGKWPWSRVGTMFEDIREGYQDGYNAR